MEHNAKKLRYQAIKRALVAREMNYRTLAQQIGYSEGTVKRYMAALKKGCSGSRFVKEAVDSFFRA